MTPATNRPHAPSVLGALALLAACGSGGGHGGGGTFAAVAPVTSSAPAPTTSTVATGGGRAQPAPKPGSGGQPGGQKPSGPVKKPAVTWRQAAHFTNASRTKIWGIVIHKAEGSNASGWFQNPASGASTHYDVHTDGKIYQSVKDEDVAWGTGNGAYNDKTISIEHAGFTAKDDITAAEFDASARLVAWLCDHYSIPVDRTHIIGHSEVPDPNHPGQFGGINHHTDPGKHWDWAAFLALVKKHKNHP